MSTLAVQRQTDVCAGIFAAVPGVHGLTKTQRRLFPAILDLLPRGMRRESDVIALCDQDDARRYATLVLRATEHARVPPRPAVVVPLNAARDNPEECIAQQMAAIVRLALVLDEAGCAFRLRAGAGALRLEIEGGPSASSLTGRLRAERLRWQRLFGVRMTVAHVAVLREDVSDAVLSEACMCRAILAAQLDAFLVRTFGLWYTRDTEYVHELRVALRRFRAALGVFRKALGEAHGPLKEASSALCRQLGAARDADVFEEFVRACGAVTPGDHRAFVAALLRWVWRARQHAYGRARAAVAAGACAKLGAAFDAAAVRLDRAVGEPGIRPAGWRARKTIKRHLSALASLGRSLRGLSPHELHEIRIRCKNMRYAAAFFGSLVPGGLDELIDALTAVQDALGVVHDCDVYRERIERFGASHAARGVRCASAARAELVARLAARRKASMKEARRAWRHLRRKSLLRAASAALARI